jgi:UDP-N-acetylglucosamine 2-epimerase
VEEVGLLLNQPERYQAMAKAIYSYGDGHAAFRIVGTLLDGFYDSARQPHCGATDGDKRPRCGLHQRDLKDG